MNALVAHKKPFAFLIATLSCGFFLLVCSCSKNEAETYIPSPYELTIPPLFDQNLIAPVIPTDNPMTQEGVTLGKKLFFDPILSDNNTQSCADCHVSQNAFTDTDRFSDGTQGILGTRNAMPLFNLAWNFGNRFFWDGRVGGLETQAFHPVRDPVEMNNQWTTVIQDLQTHPDYPRLFEQAFGITVIDSFSVVKAMAQFERTLISGNSKFDQYLLGETSLTSEELEGFNIFMDEARGDCFHCHGSDKNPLWTDNAFHNNGLDSVFTDLGLGKITGDPADNGKFKTPSLRNLIFTPPYMHDGRFETLDQVIDHYSEGLQFSANC